MESNRTVNRALNTLELISQHNEEGMTLAEIAKALEVPKSSMQSILVSLRDAKFLVYKEKEYRFFLGEALFNLGSKFTDQSNILSIIEDVMIELSDKVGYTTFFGVLVGNEIQFLLRNVPPSIKTPAFPRYRLKAHCTGVGKALILDLEKEELEQLFKDGLPKILPNTIDSVDKLYESLVEMRLNGFGTEIEESSPGIQCIAIPIRYNGNIVAAMSVSFPVSKTEAVNEEIIKSGLKEAKSKTELIISRNISKWIYSKV